MTGSEMERRQDSEGGAARLFFVTKKSESAELNGMAMDEILGFCLLGAVCACFLSLFFPSYRFGFGLYDGMARWTQRRPGRQEGWMGGILVSLKRGGRG